MSVDNAPCPIYCPPRRDRFPGLTADGRDTAGRPVTWTHHIQTQHELTQQKKPSTEIYPEGKAGPGISYSQQNIHTVICHEIKLKEILMYAVSRRRPAPILEMRLIMPFII